MSSLNALALIIVTNFFDIFLLLHLALLHSLCGFNPHWPKAKVKDSNIQQTAYFDLHLLIRKWSLYLLLSHSFL